MTQKQDPAEFQISLKILLTDKTGKYLVLPARSKSKIWRGKYDLVGGRINNNEIKNDFHQLIDREIKEEVGTQVKYILRPDPVAISMCQYPEEGKKMFILFEADYQSGKIKISKEHTSFRWINITPAIIKKHFPTVFQDLIKNYLSWNKK